MLVVRWQKLKNIATNLRGVCAVRNAVESLKHIHPVAWHIHRVGIRSTRTCIILI
jgi:hypothetical protein